MAMGDFSLSVPPLDTGGMGGGDVSPAAVTPPATQSPSGWMGYIPYASGGLSALGAIFNFIQNYQRNQQMKKLRDFYMNQWKLAADQKLSTMMGDAATKGWSGYPRGLADVTAGAYAPYAMQAGQLAQSTVNPIAGATNPFDSFLKALQSLQMVGRGGANSPATPQGPKAEPGLDFSLSTTKAGGSPSFNIPPLDLGALGG